MPRQWDQRAHTDARWIKRPLIRGGRRVAKIRAGNPDRTPSPVWQCDNDKSGTASRAFRQNCKPLAEKRMPRIRDRGHAPQPFENCIILRCSPTPPTPTRSWIASSITPIASNSSARACAAPAPKEPNPLDRKPERVRQIASVNERGARAGSSRKRGAPLSRNPRAPLSRYRRAPSSESARDRGAGRLQRFARHLSQHPAAAIAAAARHRQSSKRRMPTLRIARPVGQLGARPGSPSCPGTPSSQWPWRRANALSNTL